MASDIAGTGEPDFVAVGLDVFEDTAEVAQAVRGWTMEVRRQGLALQFQLQDHL